jgi:hypothetical protein
MYGEHTGRRCGPADARCRPAEPVALFSGQPLQCVVLDVGADGVQVSLHAPQELAEIRDHRRYDDSGMMPARRLSQMLELVEIVDIEREHSSTLPGRVRKLLLI